MGHGPWAMGRGQWAWAMGHGQWAMGHGQWAGQWADGSMPLPAAPCLSAAWSHPGTSCLVRSPASSCFRHPTRLLSMLLSNETSAASSLCRSKASSGGSCCTRGSAAAAAGGAAGVQPGAEHRHVHQHAGVCEAPAGGVVAAGAPRRHHRCAALPGRVAGGEGGDDGQEPEQA